MAWLLPGSLGQSLPSNRLTLCARISQFSSQTLLEAEWLSRIRDSSRKSVWVRVDHLAQCLVLFLPRAAGPWGLTGRLWVGAVQNIPPEGGGGRLREGNEEGDKCDQIGHNIHVCWRCKVVKLRKNSSDYKTFSAEYGRDRLLLALRQWFLRFPLKLIIFLGLYFGILFSNGCSILH